MVVYRPKDFLGRDEEARHLPDCHLEVHLGELEESAPRVIGLLAACNCDNSRRARRRLASDCCVR